MLTKAAALHVFLHGHKQAVFSRQLLYCFLIKRHCKTRIDKCSRNSLCLKQLYRVNSSLYHTAECHDSHPASFFDKLTLCKLYRLSDFLETVIGCTPWVSECNRTVICHRKFHHIGQLPLILRSHDCHIRDDRQI